MTLWRKKNSSADGPWDVRCSTGADLQPATRIRALTSSTTRHLTRTAYQVGPADRIRSDERGLENDAAVDHPSRLQQETRRRPGNLRALAELTEEIDEPAHGTDQVALVATERFLDDGGPVVVARGPAEHRRHESGMDGDRHRQVALVLRLAHRLRNLHELLQPPAELGARPQEAARDHRLAGARLLGERGADGGRLGQREVGEEPARDDLGDQQLVVVAQAGDQASLGLEIAIAHGTELLEHLHHAEKLLPVRVAESVQRLAALGDPLGQPLHLTPGLVTVRRRAPRAAMARDGATPAGRGCDRAGWWPAASPRRSA